LEPLLIVFVAIALIFDFINGFHDSANVVATVIASRAMSPPVALTLTALTNLIGPFLFGVAVATTIGSEVINEQAMTVPVALAALLSAIVWNLITWWFGIPSSSSHALIGGFVGAAVAGYGVGAIDITGLTKVLIRPVHLPILDWLSAG
jgi:PiT family inorganic phosphate transporter